MRGETIQEAFTNILLDNLQNGNEWITWLQLCNYYDASYDGRTRERQKEIFSSLKSAKSGAKKRLALRGKILVQYREMNTRGNFNTITAIRIYKRGAGDEKWLAADLQKKLNMVDSYEASYRLAIKAIEANPEIDAAKFKKEFKALGTPKISA